MHPSETTLSASEEAGLKELFELHGDQALWQKLVQDGWQYGLVDTIRQIEPLLHICTELDTAYVWSRILFPVLVCNPHDDYPDPLFWPRTICAFVRITLLADGSYRAGRWINQAIDVAHREKLPPPFIDLLMAESGYSLFMTGTREEQQVACRGFVRFLEIDFSRWIIGGRYGFFDLIVLNGIATRLCDLCLMALIAQWEIPQEVRNAAFALYIKLKTDPPFEPPGADTAAAKVLRFALRHLSAAVGYLGMDSTDPEDRELGYALPPYFELDLAAVEFHAARNDRDLLWSARRFLDAVCDWRASIGKHEVRGVLRQRLGFFSHEFLDRLRQAHRRRHADAALCDLLAEAEEILGPSRWLEERITEDTLSSGESPAMIRRYNDSERLVFRSSGRIIQLFEDAGDLVIISRDVGNGRNAPSSTPCFRVPGGVGRLSDIHTRSLGSSGSVTKTVAEVLSVPREPDRIEEYRSLRTKLHDLVRDVSNEMAEVLTPSLRAFEAGEPRDFLLVCSQPYVLSFPWSLMPLAGGRLIENVASLTLSSSVGASGLLAEIAASRDGQDPFSISAYCDCREGLQWHRLVIDANGNPAGLANLAREHGFDLRTVGIPGSDEQVADVRALNAYAGRESALILIAGHGNPKKGLRLGQDYWDPRKISRDWRLRRTECAIAPSCCLGELLWSGEGPVDPVRSEVTGFVAGLCVSRIPRVLACPWTAFDLPLCSRVVRIVKRAMELRADRQPHYWARALRDIVAENVVSPKLSQPYDDANLLLFGAP